MARIRFATRDDFPEELKYVWDRTAGPRGGALPNVFATLGRNPEVLRGFTRCGNAIWPHWGGTVAERELVILRVAYERHSAYEWHQHVRIGMEAGLTKERIVALSYWHGSELYSPKEQALLRWTDELLRTDHPSRDSFDAMLEHWSEPAIVGATMLAAYYVMTATFLGALEVETETPFVGWQLENL